MLPISLRGVVASPRAALRARGWSGARRAVPVVAAVTRSRGERARGRAGVRRRSARISVWPRCDAVRATRRTTYSKYFHLGQLRVREFTPFPERGTRERGRPLYCLTYVPNFASCLKKSYTYITIYISIHLRCVRNFLREHIYA